MIITVSSARALAQALTKAADAADAKGETSFDLLDTLEGVDDASRDELTAAILAATGG